MKKDIFALLAMFGIRDIVILDCSVGFLPSVYLFRLITNKRVSVTCIRVNESSLIHF